MGTLAYSGTGLIVSLHRIEDVEGGYSPESRNIKFKNLIWSKYDRISMKTVSSFSAFYENEIASEWEGYTKNLNLVLCPVFKDIFHGKQNSKIWMFSDQTGPDNALVSYETEKSAERKPAFGLLLSLQMNVKKLSRKNQIKIYKFIEQVAKSNCVEWNAFVSTGISDLVLICLSDHLESLWILAENIKKIELIDEQPESYCPVFSESSFTFINCYESCDKTDLELVVDFRLKPRWDSSVDKIQSWLKNNGFSDSYKIDRLSNFDYDGRLSIFPENGLSCLYAEGQGLLNGKSETYKALFSATRSYWKADQSQTDINQKLSSLFVVVSPQDRRQRISLALNSETEPLEFKDNAFAYQVQILLNEMTRILKNPEYFRWQKIISSLYKGLYKLIKKTGSYANLGDRGQTTFRTSLINDLNLVINQIKQETNPVDTFTQISLGIPESFAKLVKFYYEFINAILEFGYSLRLRRTANNAIPAVGIIISGYKISSKIYKVSASASENRCEDEKILIFNLPCSCFSDLSKTLTLLVHETAHYIPPYDRFKRNRTIISLYERQLFAWVFDVLTRVMDVRDKKDLTHKYKNDELVKRYFNNGLFTEIEYNSALDNIVMELFGISDFTESEEIKYLVEDMNQEIVDMTVDMVTSDPELNLKPVDLYLYKGNDKLKADILKESFDYFISFIKWMAHDFKEACADNQMICCSGLDEKEYVEFIEEFSKGTEYSENLELLSNRIWIVSYINSFTFNELIQGLDNQNDQTMIPFLADSFERTGSFGYLKESMKQYFRYYKLLKDKCIYDEIAEEISSLLVSLRKNSVNTVDIINRYYYRDKMLASIHPDQRMLKELMDEVDSLADCEMKTVINWQASNVVGSISELFDTINKICTEYHLIAGKLWYRGLCNNTFSLLPNITRIPGHNPEETSLHTLLVNELKRCYSNTSDTSSIWSGDGCDFPSQVALIQHYGGRTNLLDFSHDLLVSIHFALTPDVPEDRARLDRREYQPAVYLFDPDRYSNALFMLEKGHRISGADRHRVINRTKYNFGPDRFDDYFPDSLDDMSCVEANRKAKEEYLRTRDYPKVKNYPVPLVVRQVNDRILQQSGTFVLFPLDAPGSCCYGYGYLDLKEIQRKVEEDLDDNDEFNATYRFLWEIPIDKQNIEEIRKQLYILGIKPSKYYPELKDKFQTNE